MLWHALSKTWLDKGQLPTQLCETKMTNLVKPSKVESGRRLNVANTRPISIMSTFWRIFASAQCKKAKAWIDANVEDPSSELSISVDVLHARSPPNLQIPIGCLPARAFPSSPALAWWFIAINITVPDLEPGKGLQTFSYTVKEDDAEAVPEETRPAEPRSLLSFSASAKLLVASVPNRRLELVTMFSNVSMPLPARVCLLARS
ncbi:unnamed protein product [Symbiodinium sp. KB8]|nr:unnamed protein product [Symbiodinium sp. KB8]